MNRIPLATLIVALLVVGIFGTVAGQEVPNTVPGNVQIEATATPEPEVVICYAPGPRPFAYCGVDGNVYNMSGGIDKVCNFGCQNEVISSEQIREDGTPCWSSHYASCVTEPE